MSDLILNMNDVFMSKNNVNLLTYNLYNTYVQNGGQIDKYEFELLIRNLMNKFVYNNDLSSYETAEAHTVGFNDYVVALKTINADFTKICYNCK